MKYVVDIDGTICSQESNYADAKPFVDQINHFNNLYDKGNIIIYFTSRGYETGIDWTEITYDQFNAWGVKYTDIIFGKPSADMYVDDKAINANQLNIPKKLPPNTPKIWGEEEYINYYKYIAKLLKINRGANLSLQKHIYKQETWVVIRGFGKAIIGSKNYFLYPGKIINIKPGIIHQVVASRFTKLIIFESSSMEDNDIYRFTRRNII